MVNDRTVLSQHHVGPLQVQRCFYPEGDSTAHAYLLHPPGGVAAADELVISVRARTQARALLTSPGAMKLYRSDGRATATIQNRLHIAPTATLEWLPAETLVFDGARAAIDTDIQLADGGQFIGWDILCFGRPTAKERFRRGAFDQTTRLRRGPHTLLFERIRLGEDKTWLRSPWGAANNPVVATLIATPVEASISTDIVAAVRANVHTHPGELFAVSCTRSDVLIARYMGSRVERARELLTQVWEVLRPRLLQRAPCPPRIWKT